jgi:hypothetical protein
MSKILSTTTAFIMLGLAAMGSANARASTTISFTPARRVRCTRQRRLRISCPDAASSASPATCQRAYAQTTSASPTESRGKGASGHAGTFFTLPHS